MARIEIDVDDALLGEAAHALGTQGGPDTVLAALRAAVRGPLSAPGRPGITSPGDPLVPLPGDLPPRSPDVPGREDFPRPPEIR